MNLNFLFFVKDVSLRIRLALLYALFVFPPQNIYTQNIPLQEKPFPDQSNNIRYYLMQQAEKITDNALADIHTLQDWEKARATRYKQLVEMLGIQDVPLEDKRPDLNVKITGVIQKDGYRIEKLYYESLPGLYVPANLYIPDNIKEPRPAILYLCGHSEIQKVYYQDHPRKFAQLGFICLIVETIQWGEVRGEHHGCYDRGWFNWYSRGYTPGGVEAWNGIRGIDLLMEIKEVDKGNIGVTGNSGGGAISWYISAIDPRVKAAAPSCGASTLKAQILTRSIDWHCDCMMPINTFGWDFQDIGALIAPRPLLIAQSDRDGYNQIESVRQIHIDLNKIYMLYGKPENNRFIEYHGAHGYQPISRKTIFSFFLKELMGKDISPEKAGDVDHSFKVQMSEEELKVYFDGPPAGDRTTKIQDSFVRLPEAPEIANERELFAFKDSVLTFLRKKTFGAFPREEAPLSPRLVFRTLNRAEYGSDIYSFVSEEGWRLKLDIHWNNNPLDKNPLMIVLRNPEEEKEESERFITNYLKGNWNIAFLEVRGVGESGWPASLQWNIRRASAWTGRTIASMQVFDVLRCLEFCRNLGGVETDSIGIAARDEMGVVALYSALLDGGCHTLLLKNPPESQDVASRPDGTGATIEMLNCLRVTDVYQLPALLTSVDIMFVEKVPVAYKWSESIRQNLGEAGFRIIREQ
jgi:hypothetical protein